MRTPTHPPDVSKFDLAPAYDNFTSLMTFTPWYGSSAKAQVRCRPLPSHVAWGVGGQQLRSPSIMWTRCGACASTPAAPLLNLRHLPRAVSSSTLLRSPVAGLL